MEAQLFDKARQALGAEAPFVMFREPDGKVIRGLFQKDATLRYVKDFTETGFVFAPFDTTRPGVLLRPDLELQSPIANSHPTAAAGVSLGSGALEKQGTHQELVASAIKAIHAGSFEKVVLSQRFTVACRSDAIDVFHRLLARYPNAFCYLWCHPKTGVWLGASPETLIKTKGNSLKTMSLAGTLPVRPGEEPQWGQKELDEQALVTKYIRGALAKNTEEVKTGTLSTVQAGKLWHLRTELSAVLRPGNLMDLLRALHPTPAVCGLPRDRAKKYILDNENYGRGYYTGFLGRLNFPEIAQRNRNPRNTEQKVYAAHRRNSSLYVNLRCMQLENGQAHIYVGGGITAGSEPQREWQELLEKSKTMLSVLD